MNNAIRCAKGNNEKKLKLFLPTSLSSFCLCNNEKKLKLPSRLINFETSTCNNEKKLKHC